MGDIPYACLYSSYEGELALYSDEEVGRLMRALMHYQNSGSELVLSGPERYLWQRIKMQHDRDASHYNAVCEARRENGKKGGRPKSKANAFGEDFIKPNHAKEAIENEKENDKDKEKEKECVCSTHEHTLFIPPSINDVISFTRTEGLTAMDPQKFVDYYSAVGWISGGRPIRDWKAAARLWNSKDAKNTPRVVEEEDYGDTI